MANAQQKTVLISASGTGGHVFPALAVALHLQKNGVRVVWLGTPNGLEQKVIQENNIELHNIDVVRLNGQKLGQWLLAPFSIARAILQVIKIYRTVRPDTILGMGGYVTGPAGIAAFILRKPLIIHEQNAVMGMANKYLAPLATRIVEAFAGTFPSKYHAVNIGNPVRSEIVSVIEEQAKPVGDALKILVVGGSQGADFLNKVVPAAIPFLGKDTSLEIMHQSGEKLFEATKARYEELENVKATIVPFIKDMGQAYRWCDVVICRAGALTVSELFIVGKPAILVPYPYATDNHQQKNAEYLVNHGQGFVFEQEDLSPLKLAKTIKELSQNKEKFGVVVDQANAKNILTATEQVADMCLEVCDA